MSRAALGLPLGLLLIVSLVVSAPARLLSLVLPGERILLQGFDGSLWRGTVSRCLVRTGPGYLHLGRVGWQLDPISLLTLAPRLSVESQWGRQHVAGDIVLHGEQDFDLFDLEATVAADLVRQFAPLALGGSLNGNFERIAVRDGLPVRAEGRLVWQNGAWEAPQGFLPLGTYAVDIRTRDSGRLSGEVITLTGAVLAQGVAELDGRAYRIDILVGGDSGLDPQIQRALSLVATPEGERYRIQFEGEIRG